MSQTAVRAPFEVGVTPFRYPVGVVVEPSLSLVGYAHRLRRAAQAVADLDPDWATKTNGVGFSSADSRFGHALAELPEARWSAEIVRDAWEMLSGRYWAQLEDAGLSLTDLPEPPDYDDKHVTVETKMGPHQTTRGREQLRRFARASRRGVVALMYLERRTVVADPADDGRISAAVRGLDGARWEPDARQWRIPVSSRTNAEKLIEIASHFDMEVPEGFATALRGIGGEASGVEEGVWLDGTRLSVVTGFRTGAYVDCASVPGASYDKRRDRWVVPFTRDAWVKVEELAERHELAVEDKAAAMARQRFADHMRSYERSIALVPEGTIAEIPGMRDIPGKPVDGPQMAAIEYIVEHHTGVGVWDEQGVAKTAETLCALAVLGRKRIVWVCPSSVKEKIQREVMERFFEWDPRIIDGRDESKGVRVLHAFRPGATAVVILNPEILVAHAGSLTNWAPDALVLDEAHRFKESDVSWTKAALALAETVRKRGGSVATLTGTPEPSGPWELISLLEIMGRLQDFGGKTHFIRHYCGGRLVTKRNRRVWEYDSKRAKSTALELNRKLRETCMLRRRLRDVCPHLVCLPPELIYVDPSKAVMAEYREAEADIAAYMAEKAAKLAGLLGDDPHSAAVRARLKVQMAEDAIELTVLRRLAGMAKVPGSIALAKEWLALNQEVDHVAVDGTEFTKVGKLVVFGYHEDVVEALHAGLGGVAIRGSDPRKARDKARHTFQEDDSVRVITCSIMAAGEGIELTAATTGLTVEFDWVPKTHWQAISRMYRRGQTGAVLPLYVAAKGTVDDVQRRVLDDKAIISGTTIDGDPEAHGRFGADVDIEAEMYDRLIDLGAKPRR